MSTTTAPGLATRPVPPARRRLVPLLVLVLVVAGGAVLVGVARGGGSTAGLPAIDPARLLAPARSGALEPFVGTAVAQISDDVALLTTLAVGPAEARAAADRTSTSASAMALGLSLAGLTAGSHTLRIWNGGADRSRIAFVRARSETDYFRSGGRAWFWDSGRRLAVRGTTAPPTPRTLWTTAAGPVELTQELLRAPGTTAELAGSESVADRPAYGVVLRPSDPASLIDSAYVDIDAATRTPLGVQIFARGDADPAVDVAFSTIRFATPPAGLFTFRPPSDATVRDVTPDPDTTSVGSGWAPVLCFRVATGAVSAATARAAATSGAEAVVTAVRGAWGTGRLVASSALSVLLVDDGRAYAGPVVPASLYAVATAERPSR